MSEMQNNWRFDLELPVRSNYPKFEMGRYNDDLDDIRSLFIDICDALENMGAKFIVFSPEAGHWPVDVRTDLPILLEQMPDLFYFFDDPQIVFFKLDFYEQGIQKRIELSKFDNKIDVFCVSYGKSFESERWIGELSVWRSMFVSFRLKFCDLVASVSVEAVQHDWWREWLVKVRN